MNENILKELISKIDDNSVSINNKHLPYINALKAKGYIEHVNGEWLVTDDGKEYLNANKKYIESTKKE